MTFCFGVYIVNYSMPVPNQQQCEGQCLKKNICSDNIMYCNRLFLLYYKIKSGHRSVSVSVSGIVVLHEMVPQPKRFYFAFKNMAGWKFNHTGVLFPMGESYVAIQSGGGLPVTGGEGILMTPSLVLAL
jgi:hypothetical protein